MINYDQLAADYAVHRRIHPVVLQSLLSGANLHPASRVLELGCGTGNYIIAVQEAVGCRCWGVDPSAQMLARAKERSSGVAFSQSGAEKLDFPDGSFDLVYSIDVIHHVKGLQDYFDEARRVLVPGGRLCTITDDEWMIAHRKPLAVYFPGTVAADLARYPRIDHLTQMMEQAGFQAVGKIPVSFTYETSDIQRYQDKAYSCLHLITEEEHLSGMRQMEADRRRGPIACESNYLLLWGSCPGG